MLATDFTDFTEKIPNICEISDGRAVSKFRSGWKLYFGLVLAGICTNLMALSSRGASKLLGLDLGTRPFGSWWTQAIITYSLSGAIAGLIGALLFFHLRKQRSDSEAADAGIPK